MSTIKLQSQFPQSLGYQVTLEFDSGRYVWVVDLAAEGANGQETFECFKQALEYFTDVCTNAQFAAWEEA